MEILFLGTSGVGVTATRNPPSILIDRAILVDCGEGCLKSLEQLSIDITSIKAVFLTHLHADHVLGLVSILWRIAFYQKGKNRTSPRRSFPIYLPWGMRGELEKILASTFAPFQNVHFSLNISELHTKFRDSLTLKMNDSEYVIEWTKTRHDPLCYAYKFNNKVVISGDTAPFLKFADFIAESDVLIHEATFPDEKIDLAHKLKHSTPTDAALLAMTTQVTQLICTHVPNLAKSEEKHFLLDAKAIFPNISVAHDGDIVRIKR